MNTKLILAFVIFTSISGKLLAQNTLAMNFPGDTKSTKSVVSELPSYEFRASSTEDDIKNIPVDLVGEHILGKLVSEKLYLLEAKYLYEVPIIPGNPQMRTVIRKPVIYDAVMRIERYMKKSIKKGEMTTDSAAADFNKVLDVAFNVLTAETTDFEKSIKATTDPIQLTYLFTKRVKLIF